MSADWPLKKISDVAEFLNSKRVPLKSLDRDKRQGDYPYYGASGIVDYIDDYIFDGTFLLISEDGENLRSRNTPVAFKAAGKFWVNNHAHILGEKEEGILDYLEYYFSKLDLSPYITGAVQPKLNKANLDSIEIPIPPLKERLYINKVLNSFTDKIELNRQTNQTLEHIAQAIFKSWFVDFEPTRAKIAAKQNGQDPERAAMAAISGLPLTDTAAAPFAELDQLNPEQIEQLKTTAALFPGTLVDSELGKIPEGWREGCIGDIATAKGGYAFKGKSFVDEGHPVIKIKNITGDGRVDSNGAVCIDDTQAKTSKRFKLEDGDLLMAMTGATVGKIGFIVSEGKAVYLNQRVAKFESERFGKKAAWFLFCCFERDSIFDLVVGAAQGSAQPNISSSGIESTKLVLPCDDLINDFCDKTDPLFKKWLAAINENSVLENHRNTLLPKLLSGDLPI